MNHVEIIGPAGAGKSTIKDQIVDGCVVIDNDRALLNVINHLMPVPSEIARFVPKTVTSFYWTYVLTERYQNQFQNEYPLAVAAFNKAGEADNRDAFPETYFRIASELLAIQDVFSNSSINLDSEESRTVIFDEGLVQYASTVFRLGNKRLGKQYINNIPHPDVIINIDCSSEIALDRQMQRNKGMASSISPINKEEAIERLERSKEFFSLTCENMKNRGSSIITVDSGRHSPEECAEIVNKHQNWIDIRH